MRKKYKYLTYEDRKRIEKMVARGVRVTEIAEAIGVHRATIYRELRRGESPYSAEAAQNALYSELNMPSKRRERESTSYQLSFEDLEKEMRGRQ